MRNVDDADPLLPQALDDLEQPLCLLVAERGGGFIEGQDADPLLQRLEYFDQLPLGGGQFFGQGGWRDFLLEPELRQALVCLVVQPAPVHEMTPPG